MVLGVGDIASTGKIRLLTHEYFQSLEGSKKHSNGWEYTWTKQKQNLPIKHNLLKGRCMTGKTWELIEWDTWAN